MDFTKLPPPIDAKIAQALQDSQYGSKLRAQIFQILTSRGVKESTAAQFANLGSGYFEYRRGTLTRKEFETTTTQLEQGMGLSKPYFGLGENQYNLLARRLFSIVDHFIADEIGAQLN